MAQNRPPPAFQEYAASMMAKTDYRTMSLAGRGLLYSMRLECWVNQSLPRDVVKLAKVLGFDPAEVGGVLPEVEPFFAFSATTITCPELDDYREHLAGVSVKKSEGGKKGAAKTNGKRKSAATAGNTETEEGSGISRVSRGISRDSLVKFSSVQSSPTQPLERNLSPESESWVHEMERAEGSDVGDDYLKASNGE